MVKKVQKWSHSLALRISKAFALEVQSENDSSVEPTLIKNQIISTPVVIEGWTLDELLAGLHKKIFISK